MDTLTLTLRRRATDDQGTLGGVIHLPGLSLFTLELPWRNNAGGASCIPAGQYKVRWSLSPRLKRYTYEITGVPGRDGIRIHAGNFAGDRKLGYHSHSLGCPLLGMRAGTMGGQMAVFNSGIAVGKFERYLNKRPFILDIKNG